MPEQVITVTRDRLGVVGWSVVILTCGLYLVWWLFRTYTVTTSRIIVRRGIVFRQQTSIPLRNITQVNVARGPLASSMYITTSSQGTVSLVGITHGAANRIAAAIAGETGRVVPGTEAIIAPSFAPTYIAPIGQGQAGWSADGQFWWTGKQWVSRDGKRAWTGSGWVEARYD